MQELIRYETARRALAEAHTVDEVKDIRDKALALEAYAQQAKNYEMEIMAAEIRVCAERRAGELLIEMKANRQRHTGYGDQKSELREETPKLVDLGISLNQSSRWQKLAQVPEENFERCLEEARLAKQPTCALCILDEEGMLKTYMREYMRRRRASSADSADVNSAYRQFTITSLREVIRQEVDQAIQPLLVQLTKLTVNSVSNGIPPAAATQAPAKLPPERMPVLARQAKNLHTKGVSWTEIAKQWNAKGVPTLSGIGQWHGSTVAKLVRNE